MVAWLEGGGDLGPRSECAQWEAVGDAFSRDQDVGIDAVVLVSKHLAGASETRLDFVSDAQDSVLIENLLYFLEVIRRRHDNAAFAHHRLGDEGGDIGGSGETDHVIDRARALAATLFWIIAPLRSVNIRSRRKSDTGSIRPATFLASLVAGDAQSSPTASVKAGVESDELVLTGVKTRQLHGAFNGFCAAVAEESLGESARCDVRNLLGKIGNWLHVVDVGRAVDEFVHLGFGSGDDLWIIVSGVDHGDARETVEVLATVHVRDNGSAGVVDDDRHNRLHEAGHHIVFVFLDSIRHKCLWFPL